MEQTIRPYRLAVIAIGGNSLIRSDQRGTIDQQYENARITCLEIVRLIADGWYVVLTHGNGPQVGNILRRVELTAKELIRLPLDMCDAHSQGGIGYMLQQVLSNQVHLAGLGRMVTTLITRVEVDRDDPAFQNPLKPVGSFYSEAEAKEKMADHGWKMMSDANRGWRRLVPSPKPLRILELRAIRRCLDDLIPIAVGGGGVPVVRDERGCYAGVEAVIDKDLASSLLAHQLNADLLLISTAVANVQTGFGTDHAQNLNHVDLTTIKQHQDAGEFAPGSMAPKIAAAIQFLEASGHGEVIITNPKNLFDAVKGKAGTRLVKKL